MGVEEAQAGSDCGLSDAPRLLWVRVLDEAFEDLRKARECSCRDFEGWLCRKCGDVAPEDEDATCARSWRGKGAHVIGCHHAFRSARRLLLGYGLEWEKRAQLVCDLAGVDRGAVRRQAITVMLRRRGGRAA